MQIGATYASGVAVAKGTQVRKKYFINSRFQTTFILNMLVAAGSVALIFLLANEYFFWSLTQQGQAVGLPADHIFFKFIAEQHHHMAIIYGVTAVGAIIYLTVFGTILSHRVAGPLYKLQRYFEKDIHEKDFKPLSFRKNDYFTELPEAINKSIQKRK